MILPRYLYLSTCSVSLWLTLTQNWLFTKTHYFWFGFIYYHMIVCTKSLEAEHRLKFCTKIPDLIVKFPFLSVNLWKKKEKCHFNSKNVILNRFDYWLFFKFHFFRAVCIAVILAFCGVKKYKLYPVDLGILSFPSVLRNSIIKNRRSWWESLYYWDEFFILKQWPPTMKRTIRYIEYIISWLLLFMARKLVTRKYRLID